MDFLRLEDTIFSREWVLNIRGKLFTINRPQVMGIVNCTPDSFYSKSRNEHFLDQKNTIDKHVLEGATWLDLGAYSTRPDAKHISSKEEIERLKQALEYCMHMYPQIKISVDTFQVEVAEAVLNLGVHMINDVSGGTIQPEILTVVGKHQVPYVQMHMRGTPQTMQNQVQYTDFLKTVIGEIGDHLAKAKAAGIEDVIIDPGFGFAKTTEQNFELLSKMEVLQLFKSPILVGVSRKSMIYKTLAIQPEEALNGTSVLNTIALQKGASILRVHDVKQAMETVTLWSQVQTYIND